MKYILTACVIFLSACASDTITTRPTPETEVFAPPMPRAVTPDDVDVRVLTKDNAISILNQQRDGIMVGMDFNSYQNTVSTIQDMLRYIESSQSIIVYYENTLGIERE